MIVFTICYGAIFILLAFLVNRMPDDMLIRKSWRDKPKLQIDIRRLRTTVRYTYFVFGACLLAWGVFCALMNIYSSDGFMMLSLLATLVALCLEPKYYPTTSVGRYVGIWFTAFFLGLAVYYAAPDVADYFAGNYICGA